MLIGYARVSKADGSQSLDLPRDALQAAGVDAVNVYHDFATGARDDRPGLDSCMRARRAGDVLVVWKLARLGRNLAHSVNTVQTLSARGVGLRVLSGQGAQIDTTTATPPVSALCRKLGITPVALYRYVGPQGQLREQGKKVLAPRIGARQRGRVGVRTSCDRPRGGLLWAARVSAASCIVSFRILPIRVVTRRRGSACNILSAIRALPAIRRGKAAFWSAHATAPGHQQRHRCCSSWPG